jgi:hypothetical protein
LSYLTTKEEIDFFLDKFKYCYEKLKRWFMKIIKISAVWCSACIIVNKRFLEVSSNIQLSTSLNMM